MAGTCVAALDHLTMYPRLSTGGYPLNNVECIGTQSHVRNLQNEANDKSTDTSNEHTSFMLIHNINTINRSISENLFFDYLAFSNEDLIHGFNKNIKANLSRMNNSLESIIQNFTKNVHQISMPTNDEENVFAEMMIYELMPCIAPISEYKIRIKIKKVETPSPDPIELEGF
jgi:hypothetical protein